MGEILIDLLFFIIVFGCVLFLAYIVTRMIGQKANHSMKGRHIQVIETVSLGMDKQIILIKAGNEYILLAASGKQIQYLTNVSLNEELINEVGDKNTVVPTSFKNVLDRYIQFIPLGKRSKDPQNAELDNQEPNSDRFEDNLQKLKDLTASLQTKDNENGVGKGYE